MTKISERIGFIYVIHNLVNDKEYVGQTIKNPAVARLMDHIYTAFTTKLNRPLYCAMRKYGLKNFTFEILWVGPESQLNAAEKRFVRSRKTFIDTGWGYNLTTGGGQFRMSKRSILKLRTSLLKYYEDPQARARLSSIQRKYHLDNPEFAMRRGRTGKITPRRVRRKIASTLKTVWQDPTMRMTQAERCRLQWLDPEFRRKQEATRAVSSLDPDHLARVGKAARKRSKRPEFLEHLREGAQNRWETCSPDARLAHGAAQKAKWTPETRHAASRKTTKAWSKLPKSEKSRRSELGRQMAKSRARLVNGQFGGG